MATRACPFCAEDMPLSARACPHCGENLSARPGQPAPPRHVASSGGGGMTKGVLGGIGLMVLGIVITIAGLLGGYIIFWGPILAIGGLVTFVKGLTDSN